VSVFTPPARPALDEPTDGDASHHNFGLRGGWLSKQCWGIVHKIREVDRFLTREVRARAVLRETHPELLFLKLSGGRPMVHAKKSREGFLERLEVASMHFPASVDVISAVRANHKKREVADDDILDALIPAIAALRCLRTGVVKTVPANPEIDARGLRMEMVYAEP
jgi:predicted RNase H-like nuclease